MVKKYLFPILFVCFLLFVTLPIGEPPDLTPAIQEIKASNIHIQSSLKRFEQTLASLEGRVFPMQGVTITTYHMEEAQTDNSPCIGAWGDLVIPGRTCAVSHDLIWGPPYLNPGDIAVVDGEPWLIIDTMNERFTKSVDLLVAPWVQFKKVENVLFIKQKEE